MKVRTLLASAAVFAASVLAADQLALSLARYAEDELVAVDTPLTTLSLATPNGLAGTVVCDLVLLRSNRLTWNAVTNAGGYRIQRALGLGAFSTLATSVAPVYSDAAVTAGLYRYRVAATRNEWSSPVSSSITLTQPGWCL